MPSSPEQQPHPYPLFLELADADVLVVGGGAVAQRRVSTLIESGARVTVVAPQATPELEAGAAGNRLTIVRRGFEDDDVRGRVLVFSATGDVAVDCAVSRAARAAGAFVNVADDTAASDFHVPAIERRGRIQLAIGTGGAAPGLAAKLRDRLSAGIGPEWVRLADLLGEVRVLARSSVADSATRMRALRRAAGDADLLAAVARGERSAPQEVLEHAFDDTAKSTPSAIPPGAFVSIVGAGPGAPDLITVRGLERIRSADVVIYDDLVDRRMLDHAAHAELIYGGKRGWHEMSGRPSPELLAQRALEADGRHVVRLKGGDPSVFGRLDEEIAALEAAGVPYEVVPGVTSALAAAAAAKVPLTARGESASVTLATAIASGSEAEVADLLPLVRAGGTVTVYMGLRALTVIAERLIAEAIDPTVPVTIVSGASTPAEQIVRTSLGRVAFDLEASQPASPAIVIIGRVAG